MTSDQPTPRLSGEQILALKFAAHRQLARWSNKPQLSPHQHGQRSALKEAFACSKIGPSPVAASCEFLVRRATSMADGWRKLERGRFEAADGNLYSPGTPIGVTGPTAVNTIGRVFSQRERCDLREYLVAAARADERIKAAAVVGSAAADREDEWSDIDLAFRLGAGLEPADVCDAWTARMYEDHGAVDHLDVWSGRTLFRVFLLSSSMQVDLSFWPWATFAACGTSFRLLFGEANEPRPSSSPTPQTLIGMGWLYALHARSSIARGRSLQALYMVNGVRDHVVALACLRHGLPAEQGRGVDDLPLDVMEKIAETLVRGLRRSDLSAAFANATSALIDEAAQIDPGLASRLRGPIGELVRTASRPLGQAAGDALQ